MRWFSLQTVKPHLKKKMKGHVQVSWNIWVLKLGFPVFASSQLRDDTAKQSLKFNSQLFCERGLCPCLMDHCLPVAPLDFFWCYFEAVRPLVLSIVKPAVNLNTAVTSTALILACTGRHLCCPLFGATGHQGSSRNRIGSSEAVWSFQKGCRQDLMLRWGASSMSHSFFLHRVRRAESCVWASLAPTASAADS